MPSKEVSLRRKRQWTDPQVVFWHNGVDTEESMTLDESEQLALNILAEVAAGRLGPA